MVNSLDKQINTPTPQELLDERAKQIYQKYISQIKKAIKKGDIASVVDNHPTPKEQMWQEISDVCASLKGNEELLYSFKNSIRHYYNTLYWPFIESYGNQLMDMSRSSADILPIVLENPPM